MNCLCLADYLIPGKKIIYIHIDETAIHLQAGKIITYGKSYTFYKKQNFFPFLLVEVFGSY